VNQQAAFGLSRDDGGTSATALDERFAIEERDTPIVQFLIVAAQAAFGQDWCDLSIEEAGVVFRGR